MTLYLQNPTTEPGIISPSKQFNNTHSLMAYPRDHHYKDKTIFKTTRDT